MKYQIKRAAMPVDLSAAWDAPCWKNVDALEINHARPEGSDHHPHTELKLQYDCQGIYGLFDVQDRYVRCVHQQNQTWVCFDSCVEFFVQPTEKGYFNFEMNCGGTALTYYVMDWKRVGDYYESYIKLPPEDMKLLQIFHTMPSIVEPEITEPTRWRVGFFVPFALLLKYPECEAPKPGDVWHMNAYKCGDETSHPHWIAWSPVSEVNFHCPPEFGELEFL